MNHQTIKVAYTQSHLGDSQLKTFMMLPPKRRLISIFTCIMSWADLATLRI